MELLQYWQVIRRRWRWPVAFFLIALVLSSYVALQGANAYKTEMRLAVSTQPTIDPSGATYYDPIYYSNLSSEYLADDLSEFLKSESFAQEVSEELSHTFEPSHIVDVTRTRKTHRLIDVTLQTPTRDEGLELAAAMERIVSDPARVGKYLRAFDAYKGEVSVLNRPSARRGSTLPLMALEIGLRALVGLLAGLVVVFVLEYLDQTIRTRRDIDEVLALPILGELPAPRSRRGVFA